MATAPDPATPNQQPPAPPPDEAAAARRAATGYVLLLVSMLIAQGSANFMEWAMSRGMAITSIGSTLTTVSLVRLGLYILGVAILIGALRAVGLARGDASPGLLARVAAALYAIAAIDHVLITLLWMIAGDTPRETLRQIHMWGSLAALLASSAAHGATALSADTLAAEAGAPPPAALKLGVFAVAGWQLLVALLQNTMGVNLITRDSQWVWRAIAFTEAVVLYALLIWLAHAAASALARRAPARS